MFVKLVKQELGLNVVKEFQFCKDRKFKSDYYLPQLNLIIECEGGIYTGQAHGSIKGILRDIEKYNLATILGYKVLRYTPDRLYSNEVLNAIKQIYLNTKGIQL